MNTEWYKVEDIAQLDSPALLVFPERVRENITLAIKMIGDVSRLRPHVKTNKSPDVTSLMIGAGIYKFKCATIAEAEMLGQCGAKDVLLAYQPLGPKLKRFVSLIQRYPKTQYSCLTDNIEGAREQAKTFSSVGLEIPVYIDVNVGMNRTGCMPGAAAIKLYSYCSDLPGTKPIGIHAYDGHVRASDITVRTLECDRAFQEVEKLKQAIINMNLSPPAMIMGGSPAFPIHAKRGDLECSPGTFIYWDQTYVELCPEQYFLCAAVLVTRVVSLPTPTTLCLDLGHKSVASENDISRRAYFLNAPELKAIAHSEEHLVVEAWAGHSFKTGDVLYALPYHICPTVALYERAITIERGRISGEWKNIARDRRIRI